MDEQRTIAGVRIATTEEVTTISRGGLDMSAIVGWIYWTSLGVLAVSGLGVTFMDRAGAAAAVIVTAIFAIVLGLPRLIDRSAHGSGLGRMRRTLVVRRAAASESGYREAARSSVVEVDGRSWPLEEVRGVHIAHTAAPQQHGGVRHHYHVYLVLPQVATEIGRSGDAEQALELASRLADELGFSPGDVTICDAGNPLGFAVTTLLALLICAETVGLSLAIVEISDFGRHAIALLLGAPALALAVFTIDTVVAHLFGAALGKRMQEQLVPMLGSGAALHPAAAANGSPKRRKRAPRA